MRSIVALTYLNKVKKVQDRNVLFFHFKGVYLGHKINGLKAVQNVTGFKIGQVYLLFLQIIQVENSELIVKIVKRKELADLSMNKD